MKQQRSIFEFASQNIARKLETIDLTVDSEDDDLKTDDPDDSQGFKKVKIETKLEEVEDENTLTGESVSCPICSELLDNVGLVDRMVHVNTCMGKAKPEIDVKEEESSVDKLFSKETYLDFDDSVSCPICQLKLDNFDVDRRADHVESCMVKLTLDDGLVRKEAQVKVEINKDKILKKLEGILAPYVNTSIVKETTAETKIIRTPSTIRRNQKSRRSSIPPVKILTFEVEKGCEYKIAVDAFSFTPHEQISQYFLTHFHGDHYGGISKNWCYERVFEGETIEEDKYWPIIYCTEVTGKLLTLRFSIDPRFLQVLHFDRTYRIRDYSIGGFTRTELIEDESIDYKPGLYVTPITANHCPGAGIFLFKSVPMSGRDTYMLHCGDFRVNREILSHPKLAAFLNQKEDSSHALDKVYLDTTYMSPEYNFPKQETVCEAVGNMFQHLTGGEAVGKDGKSLNLFNTWFGNLTQTRITDFISSSSPSKKKILILIGTYLIGKENLAIAILKKLGGCPIYVSNIKSRNDKYQILKTYGNKYLDLVLTKEDSIDPKAPSSCVVHLVPMNIVGSVSEISKYFNHNKYFEKFERCIGLRPTGWTFLRRNNRDDNQELQFDELFLIMKDVPKFSYMEHILPQAPPITLASSKRLNDSLYRIYTLPYSEHSSFRELCYFSVMLRIREIIPTVNIESPQSIAKMNQIISVWDQASAMKSEGALPLGLGNL